MRKEVYKQNVITENLNWEILTKNLVTFKRRDVVKDEKCLGWFTKKQYIKGII